MFHSGRRNERPVRAACLVLVLAALLTALFLISRWEEKHSGFPEAVYETAGTVYQGQTYRLNGDVETLLLLGLDEYIEHEASQAHTNGKLADFLILLVFDNQEQKCTALYIDRDTMTEMDVLGVAGQSTGRITRQIAFAHTYGNGKDVSCRNVSEAVSALLCNAPIDGYLSMTMDAVSEMNDLMGGVEVTVLGDCSGIDDTLLQGAAVSLTGEQALHYIRGQSGLHDSCDDIRMRRQRQYMTAFLDKAGQCAEQDDSFLLNVSLSMAGSIVSDCSAIQLQEYFRKLSNYSFSESIQIPGEFAVGEFYPDQDELQKIALELFYVPEK